MASQFKRCKYMFSLCFLVVCSFADDRFTRGHLIRDGDTIISREEEFALGFFSPTDSDFRYVGIWYYRTANGPVVWVANRERPITGNGGILSIGDDGNLVISNESGRKIWSSNITVRSSNSTAVLSGAGNLILLENSNTVWQSFDHPTDTYLPEMKVHFSAIDEETRVFTSWRSVNDPSPGNYTMGIDRRGSPQIVIWEGMNRRWRSGHWDGVIFTGVSDQKAVFFSGFRFLSDAGGSYFTYTRPNRSDLIKFQLSWDGVERQERWIDERKEWSQIQSHPVEECDMYNVCGPFGKCSDVRKCTCLQGFVPKENDDVSRGCVRRTKLQCDKDGFMEVKSVKLPDLVDHVGSEDVKDCEKMCLQNCSCTAYAYVNAINCMIWYGDLVDVQQFVHGGSSLFIRVARSELRGKDHVIKIVVITASIVGGILVLISIWLLLKGNLKCCIGATNRNEMPRVSPSGDFSRDFSGPSEICVEGQQATGTELAMYSFNYMAAATENFSNKNKLGQGGFGHVYKGILPVGGQEIAVKRLSRKSSQGSEEFKNEIMLIAKLQHRNLVRLMGCSIEGEEKLLLYEYMPNKSLDSYLFDPVKKSQLDWSKRFSIIEGIARGLVYLHRDSRLRIIHRDLKASNILLDEEMNPKISDFGMARIFGGNQNEANTNRVVGTYGYMAPEYAMEGLFSVKSDVYSFGVLLLEIITGRRNTSLRSSEYSNIIGYAWDLWESGKAIELFDPSIMKSYREEQVLRCIHIGMLCVQDVAAQRPNMPAVVLMLGSANTALPMPRQPTFTSMRHNLDHESMWINDNQDGVSSNNVTMSVILGR